MADQQRALYNCIDAAVTLKVWNQINHELVADEPGYEPIYRQTMDLYEPVIFMSTRGLKIEREALEAEKQRVTDSIREKQAELDKMTEGKLNPMSPKSCQSYFYGYLGLQPYLNNGKITTDDTAMTRIARKGYKEASLVQEIRRLNKLFSTYLDVRVDPDGRIRASWNLRGTREGRLSSSENIFGTGLNFQNLHPQFKNFIVADPGYAFVEIDKKQAEWVIVAYLSGDARMIEAIEKGLDPHLYTASLLTGASMDSLAEEAKIIGHNTDPDLIFQLREERCKRLLEEAKFLPRTMTGRQAGKKGNHGLNYREGYTKFALLNEIPEKDAKPIVFGYRDIYCNLPLWWEQTENELRRTRILTNCFGRVRRFLGEWNDDLIRAAIAFRPQSTSVDLVNRGMTAIYYDKHDYMHPLELGAQVHDSLLIQFPLGDWYSMAKCCIQMHEHLNPTLEYHGRRFTIDSEIKVGLNWGGYDEKSNRGGMTEVPFPKNASQLAKELERAFDESIR